MKPLTVIVTASGAPGTAALLHALRENGERERRRETASKSHHEKKIFLVIDVG